MLEDRQFITFQLASDTLQCKLLVASLTDGGLTHCNAERMYFICISQQFCGQIDLMAKGFKH